MMTTLVCCVRGVTTFSMLQCEGGTPAKRVVLDEPWLTCSISDQGEIELQKSVHLTTRARRTALGRSSLRANALLPIAVCGFTLALLAYIWVAILTGSSVDVWVAAVMSLPGAILVAEQAMRASSALRTNKAERELKANTNAALIANGLRSNPAKAMKLKVDFAVTGASALHLVICAPDEGARSEYLARLRVAIKTAQKNTPTLGWLVVANNGGEPARHDVSLSSLSSKLI